MGPPRARPRDPQTATAVHDLHTGSQLPGSAERRSCLGFQGRPGAVRENTQRLNLKSEVRKTSCLSPLCDL